MDSKNYLQKENLKEILNNSKEKSKESEGDKNKLQEKDNQNKDETKIDNSPNENLKKKYEIKKNNKACCLIYWKSFLFSFIFKWKKL